MATKTWVPVLSHIMAFLKLTTVFSGNTVVPKSICVVIPSAVPVILITFSEAVFAVTKLVSVGVFSVMWILGDPSEPRGFHSPPEVGEPKPGTGLLK